MDTEAVLSAVMILFVRLIVETVMEKAFPEGAGVGL